MVCSHSRRNCVWLAVMCAVKGLSATTLPMVSLMSQKRCLCVRSDASPDGLVPADDILFACGTRGATQLMGCCAAAVAV
jgi:hypothetical protein